MNALENVTVNAGAEFAQGFQLTFRAERDLAASKEYALLNSPLLMPGSRVVISVTLNATPRVLMDGVITRHDLSPSSGAAGTSLTVTGEDLSVLMDMTELDIPYPPMPHEDVFCLLRYASRVSPDHPPAAPTTNPLNRLVPEKYDRAT
jgi:hypothetical protein